MPGKYEEKKARLVQRLGLLDRDLERIKSKAKHTIAKIAECDHQIAAAATAAAAAKPKESAPA